MWKFIDIDKTITYDEENVADDHNGDDDDDDNGDSFVDFQMLPNECNRDDAIASNSTSLIFWMR